MSPIVPQNTAGIYRIECVPTGKFYIGSSCNIAERWRSHRKLLRGNKHHSPHLQSSWNKYGEASFVFSIIETCPIEQLQIREQFYLDTLRSHDRAIGFNCGMYAGAAMRGREISAAARANISAAGKRRPPITEETRQRLRDAQKRRGPEFREKLSAANTGKKHSPATKQKIGENNRRRDPISEETRRRMKAAQQRRGPRSEETKQRMSRAQKGRIVSLEARQKQAEKMRGRKPSAETLQRRSESIKRAWIKRRARQLNDPLEEDKAQRRRDMNRVVSQHVIAPCTQAALPERGLCAVLCSKATGGDIPPLCVSTTAALNDREAPLSRSPRGSTP